MSTVVNKKTKAELRVLVAKDVKKLLKESVITPANFYFHPKGWGNLAPTCVEGKDTISAFKVFISSGCHACAVGSLFVAKVLRLNHFTIPYVTNAKVIRPYLSDLFSTRQLNLIENAYERTNFVYYSPSESPSQKEIRRACGFAPPPKLGRRSTMVKIMNNIIKNKGTFKP